MRNRDALVVVGLWAVASCQAAEPVVLDDDASPVTPRQGQLGADEALAVLAGSLTESFAQAMEPLDATERARVVNAMAWADEHPQELVVRRSRRGTITHVSGRFLAYDVAPQVDAQPSEDRIAVMFSPSGIGAALMELGPAESVELDRVVPLADDAMKFVLRHTYDGIEVYQGTVAVVLDASGRLDRFDAGPASHLDPSGGVQVQAEAAQAIAIDDLVAREDPLWEGADPQPRSATLMVANLLDWTEQDEDRYVWRVELTPAEVGPGDREVIVDAQTGEVFASIERTNFMLGPHDSIREHTGVIGAGSYTPAGLAWTGDEWDHPVLGCPSTLDFASGSTPLERDFDETKAAMCEATSMVEAATGTPWRDWLVDPTRLGLYVAVGLTPRLSVGLNSSGLIALARGVGRAEVLGHELFHTVADTSPMTSLGRGDERAAIEEHMCDVFGLLLERRFAWRTAPFAGENACRLNDDADSKNAAASIDLDPADPDLAYRWCADQGTPRAWRNVCEPAEINGGWCEGASRYADVGSNVYDTYGATSGSNEHVASHTNLGIGNRMFAALLAQPSAGFAPRFTAVGDAAVLDLLLRTVTRLSGDSSWSSYADALLDAARSIDPGPTPGPMERQLRTYLHDARIWTSARPVMAAGAGGIVHAEPTERVAAASTLVDRPGTDGLERTYVFFRPTSTSPEVRYVWRDDPSADELAGATSGWQGPCTLPGVSTRHAVAATGREDGGLWVAFNDAGAPGAAGVLRVMELQVGAEATTSDVCGDTWHELVPEKPRPILGAPSIADWTATSDRTICELLEADFPGLDLPFRAWGAMGLYLGDCTAIDERMPPFVLDLWPKEIPAWWLEHVIPELDDAFPGGLPAPFDPEAPGFGVGSFEHRIPLATAVRALDLDGEVTQVEGIGPRMADALQTHGMADALRADMQLRWELTGEGDPKTGLPDGEIRTIEFRFAQSRLVVAFRDPDGAVRVVPFMDGRPLEEIPLLEDAPVGDPVLATASQRLRDEDTGFFHELEYLYTVYGVAADDGAGTVANRLAYRIAGFVDDPLDPNAFDDSIFSPAERLDLVRDVSGTHRQVDYRTLRTTQTPVVAGTRGALDVFVVGLAPPSHAPTDGPVGSRPAYLDRIRHVTLHVAEDGTLRWDSERPVTLEGSHLGMDATAGAAGGAMYTHQRDKLRWFFPTDTQLELRTRH